MNKPNGLTVIYPEQVKDILRDLPVEKLHGIGRKTKKHLNYLGITKAYELGDASLSLLSAHFGIGGHFLKLMGVGIDNSVVPYYWKEEDEKSIGHSYTLPFNTLDLKLIRAYILMLCQKVAARLQNKGKSGRTVVLVIRYSDFETFSRQKTVNYFVDTIYGIYRICLKILRSIGEFPKPVRLLGVSVTNLTGRAKQLYLLEDFEKERELSQAISRINRKFGDFTIKPASLLLTDKNPGDLSHHRPISHPLSHLPGHDSERV